MSGAINRIDPFHAKNSWARGSRSNPGFNSIETLVGARDEFFGLSGSSRGGSQIAHIVENLRQRLGRHPENFGFFRERLENLRNLVSGRRAHLAEILSEDEVRIQPPKKRFVNPIKTFPRT